MLVKLASDATVERRVDLNGLNPINVDGIDVRLLQGFLLVRIRAPRDRVRFGRSASHDL